MSAFSLSALSASCLLVAAVAVATAQENHEAWPLLTDPFPSTGGGGIMIHDYDPVVVDGTCRTAFRAVAPDGTTYRNTVSFEAVPIQGGVLCMNGKWRAADGSAGGTTPFRVFIKDGIKRGSPQ